MAAESDIKLVDLCSKGEPSQKFEMCIYTHFFIIDADVAEVIKLLSSTQLDVDSPDKVSNSALWEHYYSVVRITGWNDSTHARCLQGKCGRV